MNIVAIFCRIDDFCLIPSELNLRTIVCLTMVGDPSDNHHVR
jgi:hypothetical protein